MLPAADQPDPLKNPDVKSLYALAIEQMEKQISENSKKDLQIKHNILLAQLTAVSGFLNAMLN